MILDRIRKETKDAHAQLEKTIVPHIKNANTSTYGHLLRKFYGYYCPLEPALDSHLNNDKVPQYTSRRKASLLLEDISFIKQSGPLHTCNVLPVIANDKQALGAMYVLEGSTLGGKIICKMLAQQLPLTSDHGLRFFNGYGQHSDEMWRSFTEALNNYTYDDEEQAEIVAAALDTFNKFKDWMSAD